MKKIIGFLFLCFFFFIPQINADYGDFIYNGEQGGNGVAPSDKSCNGYSGYCLYNSQNNVGLRITLVYCDGSGNCTNVQSINGKPVRSVDYWENDLYMKPNNFKYYASSKAEPMTFVQSNNHTYYYAIQNDAWFPHLINEDKSESYYNMYEDKISQDDLGKYFYMLSREQDISKRITMADFLAEVSAGKKHMSSSECSLKECYGFRLFFEPVFTWKHNYGKEDYILTPTELANLTSSKYDMAGNNDYRLYIQAMSLTTKRWDVFISRPDLNEFTADYKGTAYNGNIRDRLKDKNLGFGLNIADPNLDLNKFTCDNIKEYQPDIINKTYDELSKLGKVKYGPQSGDTVDAIWYRDNCSCESIYNDYSKRHSGTSLTSLSKNAIQNLFDKGEFKNFNDFLFKADKGDNQTWTMDLYLKYGCKYKDGGGINGDTTCDDVISYYQKQGIDLTNMSKSQINNFGSQGKFNSFNEAYKDKISSPWTASMYLDHCPYNSKTCDPQYGSLQNGSLGTCYKGSIEYYDSDNWEECIFPDNATSADINYKDAALSKKYCEVYCTEELKVNFSQDIVIVKTGQNFTWNNHNMQGSRTCKTKSIDWSGFNSDLKSANQSVLDKYVKWKLEEKLSKVTWTQSSTKDCDKTCDETETRYDTCYDYDEDGKKIPGSGSDCNPHDECIASSYKKYTYTPSTNNVSFSASGNGLSSSDSQSLSASCGGPGYTVSSQQLTNYENDYKNAVGTANGVINEMKGCYEQDIWNAENKLYNLDPKVDVTFKEKNYNYTGQMNKSVKYGDVINNSTCKQEYVTKITGCTGGSCSSEKVKMQNCSSVEMSKEGFASFQIPNDVFTYIIKDTHQSIHGNELERYKQMYQSQGKTFNYITLGYGNFPISFSTPIGIYGKNNGNGELSLKYKDLGHKIGDEQTKVDAYLSQNTSDVPFGDYQCDYKVVDGLIPEDKGKGDIKVVYRPIDLKNPFPDMNASGRRAGSNWCGLDECSKTSAIIDKYITNNRGVKEEEVYNLDPMYTFVLTPSMVKEIRRYNQENGYDAYYGSYQNKNYDFVCDSNNQKCISEYLTELLTMTNAKGSCINNRKDEFDSCR